MAPHVAARLAVGALFALGVLVGLLLARPAWEVGLGQRGNLALYASGQPSFPTDGYTCRATPDGYLRIVRSGR